VWGGGSGCTVVGIAVKATLGREAWKLTSHRFCLRKGENLVIAGGILEKEALSNSGAVA